MIFNNFIKFITILISIIGVISSPVSTSTGNSLEKRRAPCEANLIAQIACVVSGKIKEPGLWSCCNYDCMNQVNWGCRTYCIGKQQCGCYKGC